jgi:hypothetical protein
MGLGETGGHREEQKTKEDSTERAHAAKMESASGFPK